MKRAGELILILFSGISVILAVIACFPVGIGAIIALGSRDLNPLDPLRLVCIVLALPIALSGNIYFVRTVRAPDRWLGNLPPWGKIVVILGWIASGRIWLGLIDYFYYLWGWRQSLGNTFPLPHCWLGSSYMSNESTEGWNSAQPLAPNGTTAR